MSVMFASTPSGTRSSNGNLLEFRAGIAKLEAGSASDKRKVVADKTKGLVYIKQSQDQLMHFYWKNRETNNVDIDLIIFPGDTEFIKVKECNDGRMFMLKFKNTSDERKLFWLQDPPKDKDDELVKKVNDLLNNPPPQRHSARGGASERNASNAFNALSSIGNGDDIGALSNMDQNQLMQLFNLMQGGNASDMLPSLLMSNRSGDKEAATDDPSSGGPVPVQVPTSSQSIGDPDRNTPSASKKNVRINPEQLRSILNQVTEKGTAAFNKQKKEPIDFSKFINKSKVGSIVEKNADKLISHLPNQEPVKGDEEELRNTLTTPQFRQAVNSFGHALQTGQIGPVMKMFNVNEDAVNAAGTGDVVEFAKKLTEAESDKSEINAQINADAEAEETNESVIKEPSAKKGKPDDDNMDLD